MAAVKTPHLSNPWTADVLDENTSITTSSLLLVLAGVAVATKAPSKYVQPLVEWLQQRQNTSDSANDLDDALPFRGWLVAINSNPENSNAGTRQLVQVTLAVALLREKARAGQDLNAASIDSIWTPVYDAIITAQDTDLQFTVSRSAQGFLAVPLCSLVKDGRIQELWRLHTWLPDGQRGISEEVCIHAHQPYGQSWILLGSGTDCTFKVDTPDDPSLTTHALYECCYAPADGKQNSTGYQTHQMSSTIRNTGKLVRVTPVSRVPHSRDMTYSVPGGAYHRSIVPGGRLHATLFVFDAHRGYDDAAAVLGPKDGGEWVQPRDPDGITAEVLAQIVNATRKWEQQRGAAPEGDEEHEDVIKFYRFFRAMGLLKDGREESAFQYLDPPKRSTPAQAFAGKPSMGHQEYIKEGIKGGVVSS
ncbi:uncharacterized protein TrAtP1_002888 [Trichoderma atroviride]|uniref:Uncharacterized protein n=1 Tax=Hypocrea atroviridis (strain ATCC 20476 / IMI 206040) TaxID=452589 RepID=G9NXF8_HYPAI|nr:uncharacterized protein TRIATDRAFT_299644 [Trichoderma atroviride IMI 206040]EHK44767.1 hypothetical protein TRIATDRAFT_299644 [Trichoderma atroviride IMI 206040]UKZ61628.1 hypothetical protein TrAtP1_002888 [Trichoderma atroviride]